MRIALCLAWHAVRGYSRKLPYLYSLLLTPLLLFFVYTAIFAGGNPQRVLTLLGPALVLMATMNGLYGIGGDLLMMREIGTLLPYRLTPLRGAHIVASRLILVVVITICVGALEVLLAVALYGVRIKANPYDLLIVSVLAALALGTLGAVIVDVANGFQEAGMLSQVVFLSLLILSGLTIPLDSLPRYVQAVAHFLPTTMLVTAFSGVLVTGHRLSDYWRECVVLVMFILSTGTAAILLFRWDKDERAHWRAKGLAALSLAPLIVSGIWFNFF